MNNDLLERISSYLNGEEDEGDRRNAEVAYWLYRSCTPGTPEYNRAELLSSKHKLTSRESIIAEDYAMEHHLWFEDDGILGMVGPSGDRIHSRKPAAWSNGTYTVWDLQPKNVLKDKQDNIFVIDAEIVIS